MRPARLVLALSLAACSEPADADAPAPDAPMSADAAIEPVDAVPFTPDTCHGSPLSLHGFDHDGVTYGPATFDTTGTTICLSLDASDNLQQAHFMTATRSVPGDTSPFELALFTADDTLLVMGWDVGVGQTNTVTFENLEYSFAPGEIYAVKLVVRAKSGSATTEVGLSLFEPFE